MNVYRSLRSSRVKGILHILSHNREVIEHKEFFGVPLVVPELNLNWFLV